VLPASRQFLQQVLGGKYDADNRVNNMRWQKLGERPLQKG
jgi:hypothetical protein